MNHSPEEPSSSKPSPLAKFLGAQTLPEEANLISFFLTISFCPKLISSIVSAISISAIYAIYAIYAISAISAIIVPTPKKCLASLLKSSKFLLSIAR